ncbi:GNAT family N-acetyltransferase [Undibacterium sp. CY18W]|uniref:GNAT family N-acetyltransferase n=1 Tax=Undibacterium hunanense TaxID=2762292 RepID=A0ABR6ZW78_9BURK|nr:GNAT family N-acetyltransferase [Undibacterium hunanense]MBC3920126.1 GNAT family N-acetyltransferase [Undibacterium hunanense]
MKFSLIQTSELDPEVLRQWMALRHGNVMYDSPYYHPAFTTIAGNARADARVLLCEENNHLMGVWPFHAETAFRAVSIGGFLSDYQGPVRLPSQHWKMTDVLKTMQCRHFGFNHMPSEFADFKHHAWIESQSHTLDLTGGYETYVQRLSEKRDASLMKKVATNERKLAKKYGELRFEMQSSDLADYQALLKGKSQQFERTVGAAHDIFRLDWVCQMLEEIRLANEPGFAGMLSTLHAGDTLIAAHFGMRSEKVLHYWFPWYDTTYAEFSPGLVILAQCAKHAALLGLTSIDLGRGDQAYKLRFATGANALCEGAISSPALLATAQAGLYHSKQFLKQSSLGQQLRKLRQTKA